LDVDVIMIVLGRGRPPGKLVELWQTKWWLDTPTMATGSLKRNRQRTPVRNVASFSEEPQELEDTRTLVKRAKIDQSDLQYIILRQDKLDEIVSHSSHATSSCEPGIEVKSVEHQGLASIVVLGCKCGNCVKYNCPTDAKRIGPKGKGRAAQYELNSRIGASMVEGSMGTAHVQDFTSTLLARRPPHWSTIKRSEREYYGAAKKVSEASMLYVRSKEVEVSRSNVHLMLTAKYDRDPKDLTRSSDAAWLQRGRVSDSNVTEQCSTTIMSPTGAPTICNASFGHRAGACPIHERALAAGKPVPPHDCPINFNGCCLSMQ